MRLFMKNAGEKKIQTFAATCLRLSLLALAACSRGGGGTAVHLAGRAGAKKHCSAEKRKIAFPPERN